MSLRERTRPGRGITEPCACCQAFDAARASLDGQDEPELFYQIIAARIVGAARKGERDPIRLRDIGLAALGYKKDAI